MQWKGVDVSTIDKSSFDWLLNSLEIRRIRATLASFPAQDSVFLKKFADNLKPASDSGLNATFDAAGNGESIENEHLNAGYGFQGLDIANRRPEDDLRSKAGPDIRYCVGFLLPLIFGAMENGNSDQQKAKDGVEVLHLKDSPRILAMSLNIQPTAALISTTQRLCEKGAMSLLLACLCSQCYHVRKLAICILGLFAVVLNSNEAHEASSWRDRPQLAMIANSFQRAMVIAYAKRCSIGQSLSRDDAVPRLPSFVAIFLARASLVASRPDDAIFVAINRFFLKTEEDHGAFQDMHRLPAFISLFCSISDEPTQAKKERLFALQLLRDGCIEPACYRLAAACHAPELLLTSFDNYRSRQLLDDRDYIESSLILEALTAMVAHGGRPAVHHLVGRVGLLSWLRSVSVSRPISSLFPTTRSKISFLNLLSISVEKAAMYDKTRCDILGIEIASLTEAVINFSAAPRTNRKVLSHWQNSEDPRQGISVIMAICKALHSLRNGICLLRRNGHTLSDIMPFGASLRSSNQLLDLIPSALIEQVCISLSSLPIRLDLGEEKEARKFCDVALGCSLIGSASYDASSAILERTFLLVEYMYGQNIDPDGGLIRKLLSFGQMCTCKGEIYGLWLKCLKAIAFDRPEFHSEEIIIARDIITENPVL